METAQAFSALTEPQSASERDVHRGGDRNGRLLHGYLHKTSNSLCGIKGYASLIATDVTPDPQTARWARKILAEVEVMERVYRSIQEMAFPRRTTPTGSDLQAVVTRAALTGRQYRNLSLVQEDDIDGNLLLPAHDLELVLMELLQNCAEGRDGLNPPGLIRVDLRTFAGEGGRVLMRIRDDGPGMAADLLAQATSPFVTTKPEHLGVGLARVETIMDMYGLSWTMESRPGWGTSVVMEVAERKSRIGADLPV